MITRATLRKSAARVLRLRFELGLFDPPESSPFARLGEKDIDNAEHRELALESAISSLVLLRNERQTLPLDSAKLTRGIAVIGPNANDTAALLSDYNGCDGKGGINGKDESPPCRLVAPLQGIAAHLKRAAPAVAVKYLEGVWRSNVRPQDEKSIEAAALLAAASDAAVLVLGLVSASSLKESAVSLEGEGHDRYDLGFPGSQLKLLKAVLQAQPNTVLVIISGSFVSEPDVMRGPSAPPAIVQQFYPGSLGGTALAKALFGERSFSGKLPVTAVKSKAQLPPYLTQQLSFRPGRTHRYLTEEPLFSFGYGMTSHSITYSLPSLRPVKIDAGAVPETLALSVVVSCSGSASSGLNSTQEEVVQAYARLNVGTAAEREAGASSIPLQQLVTLKRTVLACSGGSGGRATVSLTVQTKDLKLMNAAGEMELMPGSYTLFVGGTSPRTPQRLLATGADEAEGRRGAPAKPLELPFTINSARSALARIKSDDGERAAVWSSHRFVYFSSLFLFVEVIFSPARSAIAEAAADEAALRPGFGVRSGLIHRLLLLALTALAGSAAPPATGVMTFTGSNHYETGVTDLIKQAEGYVFSVDLWLYNEDPKQSGKNSVFDFCNGAHNDNIVASFLGTTGMV